MLFNPIERAAVERQWAKIYGELIRTPVIVVEKKDNPFYSQKSAGFFPKDFKDNPFYNGKVNW